MNNRALQLVTQIIVMTLLISVVLLFLGIGVLIFIHICVVGTTLRRRFGNDRSDERGSNKSMSLHDIEKLPCFDYIAKSKGSSPVDCAVCLDNFKKGDKCRLLPFCKHSFHAQCVDSWLLKNPICPICRSEADSRRFGEDSSGFSGVSSIELRNHQQPTENLQGSDIRIELVENNTQMISPRSHENDDQIHGGVNESRENQTNLVAVGTSHGDQLS
ncbi:E3 ubiquitin-protein ligase ATL23-like [Mangifera indica]|uniref:E3 ubiquitin-protein ligase ATL23-like n=1 Tax=Mangifera indica TaxID=29780 RepID=UPI001CFA774A|nr:E3 ubiquitin-protein ligase ATL23-like [Mangifera indica]